MENLFILAGGLVALIPIAVVVLAILLFRRIVPPNTLHVVQNRAGARLFGSGENIGAVYYEWPKFLPIIGVNVVSLPRSIFNVNVEGYEGYDAKRVPFALDIQAFFRIEKFYLASQRVSSMQELEEQLLSILQGAVRATLAKHLLEDILESRAELSVSFTSEVRTQLSEWGVVTAKQLELIDIRDVNGQTVIRDLMAKQIAVINRESRLVVADNVKMAEVAEAEAQAAVAEAKEDARRRAEVARATADRQASVSREAERQATLQAKTDTATREVELRTTEVSGRERVEKEAAIIRAEASGRTSIIAAEAELESTKRKAEGVQVLGESQAAAKRADLMAPVQAQIALAEKIAELPDYQEYMVRVEQVRAQQAVGTAQAVALEKATLKFVITGGSASGGISSVSDLLSPGGGNNLGGMLEAFASTEIGKNLLSKVIPPEKKDVDSSTIRPSPDEAEQGLPDSGPLFSMAPDKKKRNSKF